MIEDDGAPLLIGVAESKDRQFGIERAGGTNKVRARTNPIYHPIVEQLAAVLTNGFLLTEPKVKFAGSEVGVGRLDGFHNRLLHFSSEPGISVIAMNQNGARRMVGVSAVDQNALCRNASSPLNVLCHRIQIL